MRFLIIIFSFVFYISSSAGNGIEGLVKEIHNSQFIIDHSAKAKFYYKSKAATKLIRKGKSAAPALVKALNDPEKIIMAHLVLCHIYDGKVSFAGPKSSSQDPDISIYYLGKENGKGMIISEKKDNGNKIFVSAEETASIISYWQTRLKS